MNGSLLLQTSDTRAATRLDEAAAKHGGALHLERVLLQQALPRLTRHQGGLMRSKVRWISLFLRLRFFPT